MRNAIGVFDSGVGGLTVVAALHRLAPHIPVRYIADSAYFPYGERTAAEIEARALALAEQLVAEGCALLVVACNTASSSALDRLREQFDVPIVGMEPPLKPAVEHSRSGKIAVLATPATARGDRLARLQDAYAGGTEVVTIAMPGLADLVEAGELAGERVERLLHRALDPLVGEGIDALALGCTHYGFLRPTLETMLGDGVEIIDSSEPVARRVLQQLTEHGIEAPSATPPAAADIICSATGDLLAFEEAIERLRRAGALLPPLRVTGPAYEARA